MFIHNWNMNEITFSYIKRFFLDLYNSLTL